MLTAPLWIAFTLIAALAQTFRNAMQRDLIATLGTAGATHVRFLFGLPFACVFLGLVILATGLPPPLPGLPALAWIGTGALAQILATGLMLAAMRDKSFVVTTAYTKTEPVQVALFGLVVLGDRLTWPLALAIGVATAGVLVMSWPHNSVGKQAFKPAALGLLAGSFFAMSAIGFRGGILQMPTPSHVMAASSVLVLGLLLQASVITLYLLALERPVLRAILKAWRPSLLAGFLGAFASQFWFLSFALTSAARVRTLALVEVIFAQMISRKMLRQRASWRELFGMALIVAGVAILLNG